MKRKFLLLVVSLLAAILAFSAFACDRTPAKPDKEVPEARTQVDTRTSPYEAYKADGTQIGTYKSIAAAINAAVATDKFTTDNSVVQLGAYVEIDGYRLFTNRNGFAEASDDQFWFYVNGNQLEAYDCYDGVLYSEYLKNNKVITHEITNRGSVSKQFHNGYALLTPDGQLDTVNSPQSWELSSTMDAAALAMPARLKGVAGLNYELDLSNVQIKPNYEGTDDTYAFIGYYAWQDYYVIATGIACNVQTGAWYPFTGTSRDDSFSDVQYNLGDTPLMISTWNEEGGYWVPEYPTLKTSIATVKKTDSLGDYYVDETRYEFYTADGTLDNTYELTIDEEYIMQYFASAAFGPENTFVFIAGLDIRTPSNGVGVHSLNTDYTNGAEFKNLTVTSATAYVPTAEELPDVDYGYEINPDTRGKTYNVLMASGEHNEEIYDYTILNTYACADYQAVDGKDVYSFSYAMKNVADTPYGGQLAVYQAQIDELYAATDENVLEMEEQINEIAALYGNGTPGSSSIAQKFYLLLDFSALTYAQDLFAKNAPLSEAGEAYKEAFNALPDLLKYDYVGWASEEEGATGYLLNDIQAFAALYQTYAEQLTEDDLARLQYHVNVSNYESYLDLMNKVTGYYPDDLTISAKEMGANANAKTFTAVEALGEISNALLKISKGTVWDTENDDPNNGKITNLNSDNNWLPSYHALYLMARIKDAGYDYPVYFDKLISICGTSTGFMEDFNYIDTVLTLAKGISTGEILVVDEKVASMVNSVMVGKTGFIEGGLAWNWNASSTPRDFHYRNKAYKTYYGLDLGVALQTYIDQVRDFLVSRAGATKGDDALSIAAPVEAQEVVISEAAGAVITMFDKAKIHGAAFDAFDEAMAAYNLLSEDDKLAVEVYSDFTMLCELIEGHRNALEAVNLEGVEDITVYAQIYYNKDTATTTMTASQALYQLNEIICRIQAGTAWTYGVDSDNGGAKTYLDFDTVAFQGIRTVVLRQYLEGAGVTLPAYFADIFTAIAYDDFFEAYDSIYQTVRLADIYAVEGKTVADMTEEDRAIFEKYWGPTYAINHHLTWNWNSGNKFEQYFSGRAGAIALQYALHSSVIIRAEFGDQITRKWIYGDLIQEYTYKGVTYYSFVYEDEAANLQCTYGSLIKGYWEREPIYIDANGDICEATAEGATMLTTSTEGVTTTGKTSAENTSPLEAGQYVTEDGQKVYKRLLWNAETNTAYITEEEDYVDAYNRSLDSSVDVSKITADVVAKAYKFYDVLGDWLESQGYVLNTNGWGYSQAPAPAAE